jgi:hypothetical protein
MTSLSKPLTYLDFLDSLVQQLDVPKMYTILSPQNMEGKEKAGIQKFDSPYDGSDG